MFTSCIVTTTSKNLASRVNFVLQELFQELWNFTLFWGSKTRFWYWSYNSWTICNSHYPFMIQELMDGARKTKHCWLIDRWKHFPLQSGGCFLNSDTVISNIRIFTKLQNIQYILSEGWWECKQVTCWWEHVVPGKAIQNLLRTSSESQYSPMLPALVKAVGDFEDTHVYIFDHCVIPFLRALKTFQSLLFSVICNDFSLRLSLGHSLSQIEVHLSIMGN